MEVPKMQVECSVVNCHYNKEDNCFANSLKVDPANSSKPSTSEETQCTTFKTKENSKTW